MAVICCSCSDKKTDDTNTNAASSHEGEVVTTSDTIPGENAVDEEPIPETPKGPDLSSASKQMNYMKNSGEWDKYEEGILPQMTEDAPEYSEKLLADGGRFIIVDKGKMKLFLYDKYGNIEKSYGIACASNYGARHKSWDSRTPEGYFTVQGVFNSSEWRFRDQNGVEGSKGVYGPKFIRIAPSIGIHGTSSPGSIGKRCSHGCIRVTNKNILELVEYVDSGMPVIVSPGPRDMAVNEREKNITLAVVTEPGTPIATPQAAPPASKNTGKPAASNDSAEKSGDHEEPAGEPAEVVVTEENAVVPEVKEAETEAPQPQPADSE